MLKYETGNDKQTSLANTRIRSSHLKKIVPENIFKIARDITNQRSPELQDMPGVVSSHSICRPCHPC